MTTVQASKRYRLVLSAVHMVYRLVNSTYSVGELTLRLTRLLCQFIHASSASVYLIDPIKKNVCMVASFDNQINILRQKPSELKNISSQVVSVTKGASVIEDFTIGLPLITDDYIGAIFIHRDEKDDAFEEFDRQLLSVFAEQVVTAIKNLQFSQQQEQIILGSIKSIGNLISKQGHSLTHTPAYMKIVRILSTQLNISDDGIRSLEYASLLHDIGIIDVPISILAKHEELTPQEQKIIRGHSTQSVNLIKPVGFLKPILPIIMHHHEHYDGSGYPSGLKKEQIPLGARIIAVVDAFEAMMQIRPYRKALTVDEAIVELKAKSGTQFDPKIVDVFLKLSRQKNFRNILSLLKG
ncbi:MAG: HD domain-containing protein [Candidatus Omnitrophica bacterium]|nr:HD domain-containing protein [Candidatus Omnitrophota bacterium]